MEQLQESPFLDVEAKMTNFLDEKDVQGGANLSQKQLDEIADLDVGHVKEDDI